MIIAFKNINITRHIRQTFIWEICNVLDRADFEAGGYNNMIFIVEGGCISCI